MYVRVFVCASDTAPAGPSRFARFMDSTKTVVAGVFGVKRPLQHAAVATTKVDPKDLNTDTGDIMVVDPELGRWEQLAQRLQQAPLIQSILDLKVCPSWGLYARVVGLESLSLSLSLSVASFPSQQAAAESDIAKSARDVKAKVDDVKGDLAEKWETSQHPYVRLPVPVTRLRLGVHAVVGGGLQVGVQRVGCVRRLVCGE